MNMLWSTKLVITVVTFIFIGFLSVYSLSIPEFLCVYSAAFRDDNKSSDATSSNGTNIEGTLKDYTLVKITKSVKNSLGFYKINEL